MDTFSRPANERAAEGAVAVGTGRLEQAGGGAVGGEPSVPPGRSPHPRPGAPGTLRSTGRACALRSRPAPRPPTPTPGFAALGGPAEGSGVRGPVTAWGGRGARRGACRDLPPVPRARKEGWAPRGAAAWGLFPNPVLGPGAPSGLLGPSMVIGRQIPPLCPPWGGLPMASTWLTCLFPASTKTPVYNCSNRLATLPSEPSHQRKWFGSPLMELPIR
ncbi:unnamed protein product [Nyctereutes procyonoides]|uniref:(raccoon dog) hypothetical protein n=1 Tax=Nyctereutes procyonoides TaxID=34880 RepID=A0A811Z3K9_NYCPR|nr:unnamed protein product [Nyctereutes procyonoides]